jgi:hypothetical protein
MLCGRIFVEFDSLIILKLTTRMLYKQGYQGGEFGLDPCLYNILVVMNKDQFTKSLPHISVN